MLIVEKMKEGGGNTAVSSGGFMIPKNEADALTYLNATYDFADSEKDPELLKVFCKEIMGVKSFMEGLKPDTKLWVYGHAGFQNLKAGKRLTSGASAARSAAATVSLTSTATPSKKTAAFRSC